MRREQWHCSSPSGLSIAPLVERFRLLERYVLAVWIGCHLANNALFCALALGLGVAIKWLL